MEDASFGEERFPVFKILDILRSRGFGFEEHSFLFRKVIYGCNARREFGGMNPDVVQLKTFLPRNEF